MMLDILLTNAAPLRATLARARSALAELDQLLADEGEEALRAWLDSARSRR